MPGCCHRHTEEEIILAAYTWLSNFVQALLICRKVAIRINSTRSSNEYDGLKVEASFIVCHTWLILFVHFIQRISQAVLMYVDASVFGRLCDLHIK